MDKLHYFFSVLILLFSSTHTLAAASTEVAVIVHPSYDLEEISSEFVSAIYLGKAKMLPSGKEIYPIDQDEAAAVRDRFHNLVTGKNKMNYKAYWYRLIFTGKGQPPQTVSDDDEMIALISSSPGFIGYISNKAVDESVKVLFQAP